jgi:iron complex transport system ATP-binding protein
MIFDVQNLCFSYDSFRMVIDNASFTLREGQIFTILGSNGAGKSTLLNCLGNLATPTGGDILLCGRPMEKMKPKHVAALVSYVQQIHIPTFAYTVMDFVTMGLAPRVGLLSKPTKDFLQLAYEILEMLGISHLALKAYTEMSGGERQLVTIARALVQKPKAILFDEPTAHLDYGNQIKTLQLIKKMASQGHGIIITTHNPDHAILLGDTVALLDKEGKLETGYYEDVITSERLQRVYDTELIVAPVPEISRSACLAPSL